MRVCFVLFFKQKTAYEMRISDWSSDVCSSDRKDKSVAELARMLAVLRAEEAADVDSTRTRSETETIREQARAEADASSAKAAAQRTAMIAESEGRAALITAENGLSESIIRMRLEQKRSEEHTSEIQSLMRH